MPVHAGRPRWLPPGGDRPRRPGGRADAAAGTRVTLLAGVAELADQIDVDRARRAKEAAEAKVEQLRAATGRTGPAAGPTGAPTGSSPPTGRWSSPRTTWHWSRPKTPYGGPRFDSRWPAPPIESAGPTPGSTGVASRPGVPGAHAARSVADPRTGRRKLFPPGRHPAVGTGPMSLRRHRVRPPPSPKPQVLREVQVNSPCQDPVSRLWRS